MDCPYCGCTMQAVPVLVGAAPAVVESGHVCQNGACEAVRVPVMPGRTLEQFRRGVAMWRATDALLRRRMGVA